MTTRDELAARMKPEDRHMLEDNIREARRYISTTSRDLDQGFVGVELKIAARLLTELYEAARAAEQELINEKLQREAEAERWREQRAASPEHQARVAAYLGDPQLRFRSAP